MVALDPMLELLQQAIPASNPARSSGIPDPSSTQSRVTSIYRYPKGKSKKRSAVDVEDDVDGKRSKGNNYQENELMELCRAWVAISEDSWVGTDQEGTTFWTRIHKRYNAAIHAPTRTLKSLKSRWGNLQRDTNKFHGCVIQVKKLNPSGYVGHDRLDMAQDLYKKDQGESYRHVRCYSILVKSPKWSKYFRKSTQKNSKNRVESSAANSDLPAPDSESTQPGLQSNNSESAQPEVQSDTVPERPIGKKKAKALHRAKGEGVDDWKEDVATAQNKIAAQAKRQNDIFDREAASLESIAKTAETNAEMAIMNKDLTNCNETVRRYFELKQKAIIDALEQSP
ncbi:hypothetical protein MJO28_017904 [Puccinia striiformis f. sp. tritici]|nr:hypothetical protein MJO28_017904 [Puccinia striiformis f. sp. tritici]